MNDLFFDFLLVHRCFITFTDFRLLETLEWTLGLIKDQHYRQELFFIIMNSSCTPFEIAGPPLKAFTHPSTLTDQSQYNLSSLQQECWGLLG